MLSAQVATNLFNWPGSLAWLDCVSEAEVPILIYSRLPLYSFVKCKISYSAFGTFVAVWLGLMPAGNAYVMNVSVSP